MTKQIHLYLKDENTKKRLDDFCAKHGTEKTLLINQLLDLTEQHNLLNSDWIKDLINSEMGEKIQNELKEKYKKSFVQLEGIKHDCPYVCPFISEPDKIICMRDWSLKSHIFKVPVETCNLCFNNGFVIPKPKTEMEILEDKEEFYKEKRHLNFLATQGIQPARYDDLSRKAKEWEEKKNRFRDASL